MTKSRSDLVCGPKRLHPCHYGWAILESIWGFKRNRFGINLWWTRKTCSTDFTSVVCQGWRVAKFSKIAERNRLCQYFPVFGVINLPPGLALVPLGKESIKYSPFSRSGSGGSNRVKRNKSSSSSHKTRPHPLTGTKTTSTKISSNLCAEGTAGKSHRSTLLEKCTKASALHN